MREIRSRISQRHGIDLTTQQIQELAARRLEAILDPRTVKPSLLEQLRRSAGTPVETKPADEALAYTFDETTLYETHRGFLRFMRRLLHPILKLFFNPNPLIQALHAQARINQSVLAREAERERRQAEWNALHYEILQRLVLEVSRTSLDVQGLSMRVESLAAKVDFNERRVRGIEKIENQVQQSRPAPRPAEPVQSPQPWSVPPTEGAPSQAAAGEGQEGGRRRRRRRRGRRSSGAPFESGAPSAVAADASAVPLAEGDVDGDIEDDEEDIAENDAAPEAPTPRDAIDTSAAAPVPAPEYSLDRFAPAVPSDAPAAAPATNEGLPAPSAGTELPDEPGPRDPHEPTDSGTSGH